jgi:hypothetical protein
MFIAVLKIKTGKGIGVLRAGSCVLATSLNIVELTGEPAGERTQAARVVNIANWSDATKSELASHEPEPTDAIVELGSKY